MLFKGLSIYEYNDPINVGSWSRNAVDSLKLITAKSDYLSPWLCSLSEAIRAVINSMQTSAGDAVCSQSYRLLVK
jgi:hypothetical protein